MVRKKLLRGRFCLCASAAAAVSLPTAESPADTAITEYQFTNYTFNATTVATDLIASPFAYVNANPSDPPFSDPAIIVQGGALPDDPPYFVGQGDWWPTSSGYNSNYFTFQVSVQPGFVLNAGTLSFVANSRQQVLFDTQVVYSNSAAFSNPVNFDANQFIIPTTENWNGFNATDAPITSGLGTFYFRINGTLDPNSNGSISDLLNLGNITLTGSVQPDAAATPMYWDPANFGAPGSGGTGSWLTANTWADGAIDYSWTDPSIAESANFAGTAGVVTLGGSVTARDGINFLTAGYNITGAAAQVLTVGGTITTNADATISAAMTNSSAGIVTKAGTANLLIAANASFTTGSTLAIAAGTLTVAAGGAVTVSAVNLATTAGTAATLALNSGSVLTNAILGGGGTSTFSFNGGTLLAAGSNTNFISGITNLLVQNGGAIINTNGQNIAITQPLTAASGSTGGLTKIGSGTLSLTVTSTYSGATLVSGGTLKLVNIPAFTSSNVISPGAVMEFNDSGDVFQTPATFTGTGTLRVTSAGGGGNYIFGGTGDVNIDFSAGALIDVQSGLLTGSSSYDGIWTSNFASLNIDSGASFNAVEGGSTGTMQIDALTGAGTFLAGYEFAFGGLTTVTIGDAGGTGVFSGKLQDDPAAHLGIVKTGAGTETFTGTNTYTGGTTITGGALTIASPGALPAGGAVVNNSVLNIDANSTSGKISGSGTLNVGALGTLATLQLATNTGTSTQSAVVVSVGSKLDITNNTLRINFGSPNNDPLPMILSDLQSGYNSGAWSGVTGIVSTTVASGSGKPTLSVGYADGNADTGTPAGPNQIVVKYTMAGDANLDGFVNSADLLAVVQNFNKTGTDWAHGNFTYITSGQSTTSGDLLLVVQNFNRTLTPAGSSGQSLGGVTLPLTESVSVQSNVPVPEPNPACIALPALAGLLMRRNRTTRLAALQYVL